MTDEELLSNVSYTNNDFRTIFPEQLNTAKLLSNNWDPSLSNESDPGNILIKENALVADKNNYHIDKSILEAFPLSATQMSSAKQIYDLVGYNMHWYKSATCNIIFGLPKSINSIESDVRSKSESSSFTIPDSKIVIKAGTPIVDSDGESIYSTLEEVILSDADNIISTKAIQGVIEQYEVNGESTITINNLDENLRIYFPQNFIAENGIFVYQEGETISAFENNPTDELSWKLVDNLSQYPAGSKVFKFGIDIYSNNCYIQFPEDIASPDLIGSGLNIYYTTTQGTLGSIKEEILNGFKSGLVINSVDISEYVKVTNSASTAGYDPETLNEAYRNYKKMIGTFDTLITRNDYENAIRDLQNNLGTDKLVSNVIVSDRTSDMNGSQVVMEAGTPDSIKKTYTEINSDDEPVIHAYDVILRLYNGTDSMRTINDYEKSFSSSNAGSYLQNITSSLEDKKAVQQDFKLYNEIQTTTKYQNIENVCTLVGTINTYNKLSKEEAKSLEEAIIEKLCKTYNCKEIDAGYEIIYEDLVSVIKSVSNNIKTVVLNLPIYEPKMVKSDGSVLKLYDTDATTGIDPIHINNETVAKMILAGNVQLFKFNTEFARDFGKGDLTEVPNVTKINVTNPIVISTNSSSPTTLNKNDMIRLYRAHFDTVATYGALCKVEYISITDEIKNSLHSGRVTFIPSTSKIKVSNISGTSLPAELTNCYVKFNNITSEPTYLSSSQSIEKLDYVPIDITSSVNYYLFTNYKNAQGESELTLAANGSYILKDNESLILRNEAGTGIVQYSVGTKIINTGSAELRLTSPAISISSILNSTDWYKWNRLSDIQIVGNDVVSLGEGDRIYSTGSGDNISYYYNLAASEDNTFQPFESIGSLKVTMDKGMLINAGPNNPQKLVGTQTVTLNNTTTINSGKTLLFNHDLYLINPENYDITGISETTGETIEYKAAYYIETSPVEGKDIIRRSGLITLPADGQPTNGYNLDFNFSSVAGREYLLPISVALSAGSIQITPGTGSKIYTSYIDHGASTDSHTTISKSGINNYVFHIVCSTANVGQKLNIKFISSDTNSKVYVGEIKVIGGLNTDEIDYDGVGNEIKQYSYSITAQKDAVKECIGDLVGHEKYDWAYIVPEQNKVLYPTAGSSYFNPNHVYNKFTFSKIDFRNSSIKVNQSNIK